MESFQEKEKFSKWSDFPFTKEFIKRKKNQSVTIDTTLFKLQIPGRLNERMHVKKEKTSKESYYKGRKKGSCSKGKKKKGRMEPIDE